MRAQCTKGIMITAHNLLRHPSPPARSCLEGRTAHRFGKRHGARFRSGAKAGLGRGRGRQVVLLIVVQSPWWTNQARGQGHRAHRLRRWFGRGRWCATPRSLSTRLSLLALWLLSLSVPIMPLSLAIRRQHKVLSLALRSVGGRRRLGCRLEPLQPVDDRRQRWPLSSHARAL